MKKVFKLTDTKLAPARQVDAVKHEVNKYVARERRKKIADGFDYWDFDCKCGADEKSAVSVHVSEINKSIDAQVALENENVYIEVIVKPAKRINQTKK